MALTDEQFQDVMAVLNDEAEKREELGKVIEQPEEFIKMLCKHWDTVIDPAKRAFANEKRTLRLLEVQLESMPAQQRQIDDEVKRLRKKVNTPK